MSRPLISSKKMMMTVGWVMLMSAGSSFAAPTSENNDRLRKALKQYPAADANKDGVLTLSEATTFRNKVRGGQKGAKTPGRKHPQLAAKTVSGDSVKPGSEIKGYNGLYMGHSFFKPSATDLLTIIPDSSVINHTEYIVMQGGQGGSPGFLWDNERNRAKGQTYLDSGKADLLVMTYYSPADSSIEHYSRWFDYALSKNPKMTFMVTIPWGKNPHDYDKALLATQNQRAAALHKMLIVPLRKKYPDNRVLYCPYGWGVYELVERFHDGKLPGVKYVLNPDKKGRTQSKQKNEQLVNDELGHGGALVGKLGALLWMQTLYNCDLSPMKPQRVEGLPGVDLNEIAETVYKKIRPFNALYNNKGAR
jgi:hypothetical protein